MGSSHSSDKRNAQAEQQAPPEKPSGFAGRTFKGKGKGKGARAAPPADGISDKDRKLADDIKSRETKLDTLQKKRQFLDLKIAEASSQAVEKLKKGDKSGAKIALNRKNLYTKQGETLDNAILTLENQTVQIEISNQNADLVEVMKQGVELQEQLNERVNPDNVAEVVDKMQELQDAGTEINDLFAQTAGAIGMETGNGDLDKELEDLQTQIADEQMLKMEQEVGTVPNQAPAQVAPAAPQPAISQPSMPAAPQQSKEDKAVEDELAALEAALLPAAGA